MQTRLMRRVMMLMSISIIISLALMLSVPIGAQDSPFATNTPQGASGGAESSGQNNFATNTPDGIPYVSPVPFATNTPQGGVPTIAPTATVTPAGPQENLFNYALRTWLEADLIELALTRIADLSDGDATNDDILALQLTLYELERRVPNAPRNFQQRQQVIEAMLQAPAGSIDMRGIVRPFIVDGINQQGGGSSFNVGGFTITLDAANFDGQTPRDALAHITYATSEENPTILYEDYVVMLGQEGGGYRLVDNNYDLFAVPFDGVIDISVRDIADVNRDSLDEIALIVRDGDVNDRLVILGYRNEEITELTLNSQQIRFGQILSWNYDAEGVRDPVLNVVTQRAESLHPDWRCLSQQPFQWEYDRNFYRVSSELNARFVDQDTLGCALYNAEPLFALAPNDAIGIIENALIDYGFDQPSSSRALMTLAMLYALEGRLEDARNTAQSVIPADEPESWAARQADAMINALANQSNTALDICEALVNASPNAACDMNMVLGRYLDLLDLRTSEPIEDQLNQVRLPVLDSVLVSEVGRADRTAVLFNLAGTEWWGFVENRDGTYSAEQIDPPAGFAAANLPQPQLSLPQAAFDTLLIENRPQGALEIVNNVERENPDLPLRPDALYLSALANDLTGNRETARQLYYETWERYPDSVWGSLAAAHLELR